MQVLPVLENGGKYIPENPELGLKGHIKNRSGYLSEWDDHDFYNDHQPYLARNKRLFVNFSEILPQVSSREDIANIDRRWKLLKMTRHVRGMKKAISFARRKGLPHKEDSWFMEEGAHIGSCLRPYDATEWGNDMSLDGVSFAQAHSSKHQALTDSTGAATCVARILSPRDYMAHGAKTRGDGVQSGHLWK